MGMKTKLGEKWPDGSSVFESANVPGKWVAIVGSGDFITDDDRRLKYFDGQESATEALREIGQGPGR